MYNSDDPGASLATAKIAPSITGFAAEEYLRFRGSGPQENYTNGRTWLGSGQNVIIASRETKLGAIFCRVQVNKYALRLPCCGSSATIIPPLTIHTSQGMDACVNQPVDIFSQPRLDFSPKQGWRLMIVLCPVHSE